MSAPRTARDRARAEITAEIKSTACRHLAREGASALSLRAVARDLGMVSSAVYRYFPSRDDLLTALIIDAYDAIGTAAEQADAELVRDDLGGRWRAACRAVRAWALAHPHEYALIYGSPVPGYRAPEDTIGPATRVALVLSSLLCDAAAPGLLVPPVDAPPLPATLAPDAARLRETIMPGVPDDATVRGLLAWTHVFGVVSFELFGQYNNVVDDTDAFYDHAVECAARFVGLPDPIPDGIPDDGGRPP